MARKTVGAAIAEPGPVESNWSAVSSSVATAVAERTTHRVEADIARWRELIGTLANGVDLPSDTVDELTDLASRLRLPASAISDDVAAIRRARQNAEEVVRMNVDTERVLEEGGAAGKEVIELRAKLRQAEAKVEAARLAPGRRARFVEQVEEDRRKSTRLFGDISTVAKEIAK